MAGEGLTRRYQPKYASRNEAIIAGLREAAGAAAPIDPALKVKRLTAEVATLMALIHGGHWRVKVDHLEGLVVIARLEGDQRTL